MYDPTAAYRATQVASSSPAAQVVLLYQGAIRFAGLHLSALERGNLEGAHNASIRAQAIVSALQEVLDMSAGPIATQLDQLYDYVLDRLARGNAHKEPRPTEEAIAVLRGLLEAWQAIAAPDGAGLPARATDGAGDGPRAQPAGASPLGGSYTASAGVR